MTRTTDPRTRRSRREDDVDTDKDGVPDYKDDFPKNAKYSKDADGDGVADPIDDFPKDERYSKDSDGDKVADSEDVFPADPSRSKITAAMQNAISAARSYLDYTAFSRSGLIQQSRIRGLRDRRRDLRRRLSEGRLERAGIQVREVLPRLHQFFSPGLIEQLQFEGFTYEQAAYGANKAY